MGRNNADFDKDRIPGFTLPSKEDIEKHNLNKGNWRVALQQEHGRAVEALDRANGGRGGE